jgi:cobalt/nickel transport system permease protein
MTYRYIFLSIDELLRMLRAREARTFGKLGARRSVKLVAGVISTSISRSYERGERVYQAMLARGFDGSFRTFNDLKLRLPGVIGGLLMIMALVTMILADAGVIFPTLVPTLRSYISMLTGW